MLRLNGKSRLISGLLMFGCIIWGYWWLAWVLAIIFLFIFPVYYEILAWGVIYDALYGLSLMQFQGFPYIFTLFSVILFLLSIFIKKQLLAYETN